MNSLEKSEKIAKAAELQLKGHSVASIARILKLTPYTIRGYIKEWDSYISNKAAEDPDVLNNFLENVLSYKEKLNIITVEAWKVADLAEEHGAMSTKIQALRLAKDLAEMEARVMQLMSNRMDSGYLERMKRLERVNGVLSGVIREVISGCERCSTQAWRRLEEIYSIQPDLAEEEEGSTLAIESRTKPVE